MGNEQPLASTAVGLGMDLTQFDAGNAKARSTLTATTQHFERELNRTTRASEVMGAKTATALDLATHKWGGFGAVLKGAQPAIAGMSGAVAALGQTASPAVNQLAGSLSSLLMGGFTPLGLAIGAVTTAIGLFSAATASSTSETSKQTKELEKQVDVWAKLDTRAKGLAAKQLAPASSDVADLMLKRQSLQMDMGALTLARPLGRTGSREERIRIVAEQKQWEENRARIELEMQRIDAQISQYRNIEEEEKRLELAAKEAKDAAERATDAIKDLERSRRDQVLLPGVTPPGDFSYLNGEPADPRTAADLADFRFRQRQKYHADLARQARVFGDRQWDPDNMPTRDPYEDLMPPDGAADAEAKKREQLLEAQRKATMNLRQELSLTARVMNDVGDAAQEGLADSLTDSLMAAQRGAESFGEAFSNLALGVVEDIERMILKQLVFNQISNFVVGAFTNTASPVAKTTPWSTAPIVNNADGGNYRVGGIGGVDSSFIAMRATPGELIDVTPQGKTREQPAGDGVLVVVNNHTGQQATQKRSRGANGREVIEVTVGQAAAADLDKGGPLSRSLERNYGMRRSPRRG